MLPSPPRLSLSLLAVRPLKKLAIWTKQWLQTLKPTLKQLKLLAKKWLLKLTLLSPTPLLLLTKLLQTQKPLSKTKAKLKLRPTNRLA